MATLPERLTDGVIVVRRYRLDDATALQAAVEASLAELRPWMPWAATEPIALEERAAFLRGSIDAWGDDYTVGIWDAADETRFLGGTGLHARIGPGGWEIGYWVRTDAAGLGIATRAARLLTSAAFEHLGADHVEIHHDEANERSGRIPRRLGFELVATEPDPPVAPGDSGIECRWRMTDDRWRAAQTSAAAR
ncbi:MAG: GNAT family protein [Actinomycetota bacterium]